MKRRSKHTQEFIGKKQNGNVFVIGIILLTDHFIHRYGQEKEVFCKVYFAPVSVESRLLEWRHRFESRQSKSSGEKTLFAPLRDVSGDNAEAIETDQTQFLLGLI